MSNDYNFVRQGWLCPVCKRINAPAVVCCPCSVPTYSVPSVTVGPVINMCGCSCHYKYETSGNSSVVHWTAEPCEQCQDRHNVKPQMRVGL